MKNSPVMINVLCGVFALLSFVSSSTSSAQSWGFYQPVTVDNVAGSVGLAEHQVLVSVDTASLIGAGKMRADGGDLRFYAGSTEQLCHTVESGLNTASTSVWVRVPSVPSNGTATIYMVYGNPAAESADDPNCTFSFFEDFEDAAIRLTQTCGTPSVSVSNGELDLSWSSTGMLIADTTFPLNEVHMVEANVTGASGNWPGIHWGRTTNIKSYALLTDSSQARISTHGGGTDTCSGHNWVSDLINYASAAGIWVHTWVDTGDIRSSFPTIGAITSNDTTYARDEDLQLTIGGLSNGVGSMSMDWIRTRKWAEIQPTASAGAESPTLPVNVSPDDVTVTEPSGSDTFDLSIGFAPMTDVTLQAIADDMSACTVNPSTVMLGGSSLQEAISVTAVTDDAPLGNRMCLISFLPTDLGGEFIVGADLPIVTVTVNDDGTPVELSEFAID